MKNRRQRLHGTEQFEVVTKTVSLRRRLTPVSALFSVLRCFFARFFDIMGLGLDGT